MGQEIELTQLDTKVIPPTKGYISFIYEIKINDDLFDDYKDANPIYSPEYPLKLLEETATDLLDLRYRLEGDQKEEYIIKSSQFEGIERGLKENIMTKGKFEVEVNTDYTGHLTGNQSKDELIEEMDQLIEVNNSIREIEEEREVVTDHIKTVDKDELAEAPS